MLVALALGALLPIRLDSSDHHEVRCLEGAVDAVSQDPGAFAEVAERCRAELSSLMPAGDWPTEAVDLVTAALIAHRVAPYGESRHGALDQHLTEPSLHCGTYAEVTLQLSGIDAQVIGFAGGVPVGNHAQIMWGDRLLIDPTVGVVAAVSFDELLAGVQARTIDMGVWRDDPHLDDYRGKVIRALSEGLYRPSDLLYFYHSADEYLAGWWQYDDVERLPTPAARDYTLVRAPGQG